MERVYVTRPFMPPIEEFQKYVSEIFERKILTNQGPLLKKLENSLENYLSVENLHFVTNGTLALQLALSSLGIDEGEVITTPFSYVATSSSILSQRCKPIFVDIEPENFTLDSNKIEEKITERTKALMAVHVFGYACNVDKIGSIAEKHNLKVIYDGAHCFGCQYNGKSLASYGDVSTLSFHATKIYNTIEGGACIVKDKNVSNRLELEKRFGHEGDDHLIHGINAKASEFQAAMGLANLPHIERIMAERKSLSELYDKELEDCLRKPKSQKGLTYNYAYYPVVFKSESELLKVSNILNKSGIYPRRYFYPSLNKVPYINGESCPVSEDISTRIACLPLYVGLEKENVKRISRIIKESL